MRLNVPAENFGDVITHIINHLGNNYNLTGYYCTGSVPEAFNTMLSAPISANPGLFHSGHIASGLYLALNNVKQQMDRRQTIFF